MCHRSNFTTFGKQVAQSAWKCKFFFAHSIDSGELLNVYKKNNYVVLTFTLNGKKREFHINNWIRVDVAYLIVQSNRYSYTICQLFVELMWEASPEKKPTVTTSKVRLCSCVFPNGQVEKFLIFVEWFILLGLLAPPTWVLMSSL